MTDSSYPNELLASKLNDLLDAELQESDVRWSYRKAASVLSSFDMQSIQPFDGPEGDQDAALESLYSESQLILDANRRPRWMLRSDTRRAALERLESVDNIRKALLNVSDRPNDPLQKMLEDYIFEKAPPLENQSHQQLLRTLQISEWLNGIVTGVPEPQVVLHRLEIENLLASFRFLVGDHFRGRTAELARLSEYVGVMDASSFTTLVTRGFRQFFSFSEKPPLVLHGPGGVGKSTLLAKFILDHVMLATSSSPTETSDVDSNRFPFAYLDFDRPSLIAEEPVTLLLEALRQMEVQFPNSSTSLKKVRDAWNQRIERRTSRRRQPADSAEGGASRIDKRDLFLDEFAEEMKPLLTGGKPLLFILDTFEEVQYRSSAFVEEVFDFLESLQRRIPTLRTVLSGRAPIESVKFKTEGVPISIFDTEIAQGFLQSHGITDPELARLVAVQVGGSPLTLKLAVELLRREDPGAKGIKNLKTRDGLLKKLDDGAIQVQLFTRILEHIHDRDVAKLAHPGLVLRRITPELILKVLAGPCEVDVPNIERARELFAELGREVALVSQAGDNALIHRSDLRKVMLEPLRKDKAEKVKQIHRNAIEYYQAFDDGVSRAEEIYHRLSLGIERQNLEGRWADGVQQNLGSAIEELPLKSRAFLAAKLKLEVDESVWQEAELEDWEIHARMRATDLLALRQPLAALNILRQRQERTFGSPLLMLERDTIVALLTAIHSHFSVYYTEGIATGVTAKSYHALLFALQELQPRPETLIEVQKELKLQTTGANA
ncbi:MAG TPA: hypothetical protein VFX63_00985 [Pyrinomonadaceae bacterium]|nr:hypothetical protein [Pyrinomonadaceae bacterium]